MNGDMTSMMDSSTGGFMNLTYDVFGNLKVAELPSKTISYAVDAHNRRMIRKENNVPVTHYIWNSSNQLVGTADGSGVFQARYVYGSKAHVPDYMVKDSVNYQIVSNHLGSPVSVVNAITGEVVQEIKYDEWGNILSDTNPGFTPFGFAGCLYDLDTKLCRFGARDYDASIGRWLSKDPILFAGGDTNLYGYVFQDPVNFIDPTGLICQYSQGSGQMTCRNASGSIYYNESGYSGRGSGRNNPSSEAVPFVGPIPRGTYTVGGTSNTRGPNTITLIPDATTRASISSMGRQPDTFRIHGNNASNNASEGCIILPPNRTQIPSGETINVGQ